MTTSPDQPYELPPAEQVSFGESDDVNRLYVEYRGRLRQLVALRMDPRLRGRIDPSDVIQETFALATKRIASRDQRMTPYLWLRFLTLQKLAEQHRIHVRVKARSVNREASLRRPHSMDCR